MTRKSNRRVVSALAAVALAGTLAACSGGQPGAAAVVGDRVIPVSDVDAATRELADVLQGVTPASVVGVLIQEPLVAAVAEDAGVGVSDQQAAEVLAQGLETAGADSDREFSASSLTVARYVLELQAVQQLSDAQDRIAELQDGIVSLDFTINPRFGTPIENGMIGATTYPWLVVSDTAGEAVAP